MRNATLVSAALFAILSPLAIAQQIEETRHHRIPVAQGIPLKVMTRNGDIEIVRTDSTEMVITAVARAKTKERLALIQFSATSTAADGSNVHVDFPPPEKGQSEACSLRIELPKANGIMATTSNGGITCYGMAGNAEFVTSNGAISVEKQDGPVQATTSNGAVTIKLASAPAKVRTSNGPVTFTLLDSASAPFDLETSNGAVSVILSPAYTGIVDLATSNGRITFPQDASAKKKPENAPGKGWGASSAKFTRGTGTEESRIRTSNGAIDVSVGSTAAEDAPQPPARPTR